MQEKTIARSSMVPVLGCLALMLFSLSSYNIFDKEIFSKWKSSWCQTEEQHAVVIHKDGHFAFEFEGAEEAIAQAQRAIERANLDRTEVLRVNLERAEQQLALVREQHANDLPVEINLERLEEELAAKERSLQARERVWSSSNEARLDWKCEMDHENHSDVQVHVLR